MTGCCVEHYEEHLKSTPGQGHTEVYQERLVYQEVFRRQHGMIVAKNVKLRTESVRHQIATAAGPAGGMQATEASTATAARHSDTVE